MLNIEIGQDNRMSLSGRFDASQVEKARGVFLALAAPTTVDFGGLEYISSAGLGVLLAAQKRLSELGHGLKFVNVTGYIRDVLHFSGFDQVFDIE